MNAAEHDDVGPCLRGFTTQPEGVADKIGDVLNFREMVIVVGDRIKSMIDAGMTLEQVKAAKPTFTYDPVYGARAGAAERFIEETYQTLSAPPGESK